MEIGGLEELWELLRALSFALRRFGSVLAIILSRVYHKSMDIPKRVGPYVCRIYSRLYQFHDLHPIASRHICTLNILFSWQGRVKKKSSERHVMRSNHPQYCTNTSISTASLGSSKVQMFGGKAQCQLVAKHPATCCPERCQSIPPPSMRTMDH
jgi:hypothetical protein